MAFVGAYLIKDSLKYLFMTTKEKKERPKKRLSLKNNIHYHNNFEYKVWKIPIDFLSLWQIIN